MNNKKIINIPEEVKEVRNTISNLKERVDNLDSRADINSFVLTNDWTILDVRTQVTKIKSVIKSQYLY